MNALVKDPMLEFKPEGSPQMLIYEDLARSRRLEAEQDAHARRLVRRLSTAKRWHRISRWAARRADRVTAQL
ncbi:hypothetical protein [Actinokineospora globicatena]|uniref:Uncharacterized protein n=1 Tax=Actinokineospora globicatena TaxID=103729 RepID=A0A9W6QSH1_9PSEU|nr:hypothetical protein [Actinokineospora globicatena]MCP2304960.1 hypothetical protein [Actinokineospora globicatena]GLW80420.1 hypothetical protein Aglo01_49010 [Actinokineospora globicatena]GLW87248.1 hypothetical protein Aglo02_48870 [Actinokineospora globicatena]GLW94018.1 hypothetical protein Aglo03_48340 [Actinokineospora globicatena]